MPPQSSGAASSERSASGIGKAYAPLTRIASAKPPLLPPAHVGTDLAQQAWQSAVHTSQLSHADLNHPTPTRCPAARPLTSGPSAATVPMISWPLTCGKTEYGPQCPLQRW